jgi:membrane fusion protein (multidrug efflux system)
VKKLLLVLLLLGAALAGGAWFLTQRYAGQRGAACTEVAVEYGPLAETVSVTAVIQPPRVYPVGTEAVGKVVEVAADFNQVVEEGAVLLRLDDRAARQKRDQAATAVDAARAALGQAEGTRDAALAVLERERRLDPALRRVTETRLAEGHLKSAEAAVEAARVKIRQAQQELALAELALEHTVVRAPVLREEDADHAGVGALAGEKPVSSRAPRKFVVLDRKVSLNQMIEPPLNGQLFTLAGDQAVMHVEAQVPEGDAGKIRRGLEAEFTVASEDADLHFRGKVKDVRLLPINDRGAIYYKVIIEARNQRDPATGRWRLTPGLTATVDLQLRKRAHAWKMPAMALSFQPEEAQLSKQAREKLKRWESVKDADWWKPVWVAGTDGKPWPVFVRVGGKGPAGETGLHDLSFTEVLEWDPELAPRPEAGKPSTHPRVIIAAPPGKHGLFNPPNLKL